MRRIMAKFIAAGRVCELSRPSGSPKPLEDYRGEFQGFPELAGHAQDHGQVHRGRPQATAPNG
jgi:hypothetical protein